MSLVKRLNTKPGINPFDEVDWDTRTATITNEKGDTVFEQKDVEVPLSWSEIATNVVASKYFAGKIGTNDRETSIKQLIGRVAKTISDWGVKDGYFDSLEDRNIFEGELTHLLLHQKAAFNSPVWFNVGVNEKPQCSACFINSVEDTMESILDLVKTEGMLFKFGSGTGTNLSTLRSSKEYLSHSNGKSSGPVSFMKGFDSFAGVIKSGGKTRRAAKMVILNDNHPDIEDFIICKSKEEEKAYALIKQGYDPSIDGEAYSSVYFQNANHSVRLSNNFMRAVENDDIWYTLEVTTGNVSKTVNARDLFTQIIDSSWKCGDPGIQFDDTINNWHTCPNTSRINASNPCCFVGDTKVLTTEGRIPIDILEQMSKNGKTLPMAVTYDPDTRLPTIRNIKKAWKTGETSKLVTIITERGLVLNCTPEHIFYLRNGKAVKAKNLKNGQRLSKVGISKNKNRSDRLQLSYRPTVEHPRGFVLYSRWLWSQAFGPIPYGMEIHHRNGDPTDDRLSNMEIIHSKEHRSIHSSGNSNNMFLDTPDNVLVHIWEEIENCRPGFGATVYRWNKYIDDNKLNGIVAKANPVRGIRGMSWEEFSKWIDSKRSLVNDKVKFVEEIDVEPTPVYDLEVEGVHRFAVSSDDIPHGVIVSNSEYMFLDDSACNLSSLNLIKFKLRDGEFDIDWFAHAVSVMIIAMDIIVGNSSYPTEKIAKNSHDFRPLGLGYANLGALLMSIGLPYDSERGRSYAGAITALMTGYAYKTSAIIAEKMGAFSGYKKNRDPMLDVVKKHKLHLDKSILDTSIIYHDSNIAYKTALSIGNKHGFRNSQVTVLAPTGTIAFMMDCDTTGVEPDIALVKYKKLVGGGLIKMVNSTLTKTLESLEYDDKYIVTILNYVEHNETIEGAPGLSENHLPVFDCAFKPENGERSISPMGHIKMMEAVQPFISGAISKTINMPNDATPDDIEQIYMKAWKKGLKSISIYRDGCKQTQPLSTSLKNEVDQTSIRKRLPDERKSITHKFSIAEHEGYITVGMYENGDPGEMFIIMSKEGSTISGIMDSFATSVSIALQHGVPISVLIGKLKHTRFEPSGFTKNSNIPIASSIMDYIARWLEMKFLSSDKEDNNKSDAPICSECGDIMVRNGTCHRCLNCGLTSGCS